MPKQSVHASSAQQHAIVYGLVYVDLSLHKIQRNRDKMSVIREGKLFRGETLNFSSLLRFTCQIFPALELVGGGSLDHTAVHE